MDTIYEGQPISRRGSRQRFLKWEGNANFQMNTKGEIVNRRNGQKITKEEIKEQGETILEELVDFVHQRMLQDLNFVEQCIPPLAPEVNGSVLLSPTMSSYASSASSNTLPTSERGTTLHEQTDPNIPRCVFHTSQNYSIAEKLLVFVCSSRGLSSGIWSRSLLLQDGIQVGSMIPYFENAIKAGFGILVMNPNENTKLVTDPLTGKQTKLAVSGSSTQEEHVEHVWKNYIFPCAAHKIHLLAYGYGGILVLDLVEKYKYELKNRLGNIGFIESSHKINPRWASAFKQWFSQRSICWKSSAEPLNAEISGKDAVFVPGSEEYGCLCLSAGPMTDGKSRTSPAYSTQAVLDTIFRFFDAPNAYEFQRSAERRRRQTKMDGVVVHDLHSVQAGLKNTTLHKDRKISNAESSSSKVGYAIDVNSQNENHPPPAPHAEASSTRCRRGRSRSRSRSRSKSDGKALQQPSQAVNESVTIEDFELLRVVGRGAFGKVMLVRRKPTPTPTPTPLQTTSQRSGNGAVIPPPVSSKVYAMKVIKKAAVFAKHQVEHTKTERRILQGVDHPFMVKLRYAFQNASKLYFVMDYYNGGTLHFHLRQAKVFSEQRARFYAAQLVLAISHLHTYNIVYRDLKPENILMDDEGFIALTDFGLSRDNFDEKDGMFTFCGTPEYIAPELIRRVPYGKAVDFWSFGVLLYEMLAGATPFYHVNRKQSFENILTRPLRFYGEFSENAKSVLRGLMHKDPSKRLGSGPCGVQEIMDHPFFSEINWEKLYKRDAVVPFKPIVKRDGEVGNVPEFFKRQEAMDSISLDPIPANSAAKQAFENFTYMDPFQMDA